LGAYLKRYAEEELKHHVQAFEEVRSCILDAPVAKDSCEWTPHYFEGVALTNVALGVYAVNASKYKQSYPEAFDKLVYVKLPWQGKDIDGAFEIDEIRGLFEVSISYDYEHVAKCKSAVEQGLGDYCIYGVLNYDKIECINVKGGDGCNEGDRCVIVAPLPLALLIF
jgi:hypothetical protein